ncbi:MAG: type II toxin-antitoxin system HicB family antitoxin, partial [Planctomycetaceae bacterium]
MLMYKAMYKIDDDGVTALVLDFPGAISCGDDLPDARRMLHDALVLMAETYLADGKPLPTPDPTLTSDDSDVEEPIYLLLSAASKVAVV